MPQRRSQLPIGSVTDPNSVRSRSIASADRGPFEHGFDVLLQVPGVYGARHDGGDPFGVGGIAVGGLYQRSGLARLYQPAKRLISGSHFVRYHAASQPDRSGPREAAAGPTSLSGWCRCSSRRRYGPRRRGRGCGGPTGSACCGRPSPRRRRLPAARAAASREPHPSWTPPTTRRGATLPCRRSRSSAGTCSSRTTAALSGISRPPTITTSISDSRSRLKLASTASMTSAALITSERLSRLQGRRRTWLTRPRRREEGPRAPFPGSSRCRGTLARCRTG